MVENETPNEHFLVDTQSCELWIKGSCDEVFKKIHALLRRVEVVVDQAGGFADGNLVERQSYQEWPQTEVENDSLVFFEGYGWEVSLVWSLGHAGESDPKKLFIAPVRDFTLF